MKAMCELYRFKILAMARHDSLKYRYLFWITLEFELWSWVSCNKKTVHDLRENLTKYLPTLLLRANCKIRTACKNAVK